jgi:hypothetical protein
LPNQALVPSQMGRDPAAPKPAGLADELDLLTGNGMTTPHNPTWRY